MASLLPRARPSHACADPGLLRRFTGFKILILLLLIGAIIGIVAFPSVTAPSLAAPPATIISGELRLEGRGTPGSPLELLGNEVLLGTTTVDDDGRWSLTPVFAVGRYDLLARAAVDDDRRLSDANGQAQLEVVDRPTLQISAPPAKNDQVPVTLSGRGTPGSTLRLLWNEEAIATIQVEPEGRWQHLLSAVTVPSENEFVAQVLDGSGVALGASPPRHLKLQAVSLAPLHIEQVVLVRLVRDSQDDVVNGELLVSGTGEPGAIISLWRETSPAVAEAVVAPDGTWEVTAQLALAPGDYLFSARMRDPGEGLLQEEPFSLALPAPPTLRVAGGKTDVDDVHLSGRAQPNESLALEVDETTIATVETDGEGRWQHTIRLDAGTHHLLARSANGLDSERQELSVALARPVIIGQSRDEQGNVLPGFYGKGRPHTQLEIVTAGDIIGQATVDAGGEWRCRCTLAPGEHLVSVREVREPQRASEPLTLTIDNPLPAFIPGPGDPDAPPFRCPDPSPPGVVQGGVYVIGCGESLGLIAARLGVTIEQLLTHNPQLSHPPQVYFGQRLNVPAGASCSDEAAAS